MTLGQGRKRRIDPAHLSSTLIYMDRKVRQTNIEFHTGRVWCMTFQRPLVKLLIALLYKWRWPKILPTTGEKQNNNLENKKQKGVIKSK